MANVYLFILYYTWNKRSNILQKVNGWFAFTKNILKRLVKAFHQMGMIVLYKFI